MGGDGLPVIGRVSTYALVVLSGIEKNLGAGGRGINHLWLSAFRLKELLLGLTELDPPWGPQPLLCTHISTPAKSKLPFPLTVTYLAAPT